MEFLQRSPTQTPQRSPLYIPETDFDPSKREYTCIETIEMETRLSASSLVYEVISFACCYVMSCSKSKIPMFLLVMCRALICLELSTRCLHTRQELAR
jgi:hypothetical protein